MGAAAAFALVALVAGRTVVENDLFWHLAIGEEILAHGFPFTDPFGLGTEGLRWSPPEWLAELGLAGVHRSLGFSGIAALWALFVGGIGALVFARARVLGAPPSHALFAVVLLSLPASVHLAMRPLVVGHLLSALVLLELARDRRSGAEANARTLVPFFPVLFALWANLHPSWPLGLLWIAIELFGRLVSGPLSRRFPTRVVPTPVSRGLLIALSSPLFVLLRPDGLDGALYPFVHVIGLGDQMREIIEWFPLPLGRPLSILTLLTALLALGLTLRSKARVAVADVLVAGVSLYLLVRYQRFLPLALLGIAPLLASQLPELASTARLRALLEGRFAVPAALVALALAALAFPSPAVLDESIAVGFPVHATDALVALDAERRARGEPTLRVFTTFEDGGYVTYRRRRTSSDTRVYLDSRFDLYARAGIFREYLTLRAGEPGLPVFSRHRMDAAILPTAARDAHFDPLRRELEASGFVALASDDSAVLLVRQP